MDVNRCSTISRPMDAILRSMSSMTRASMGARSPTPLGRSWEVRAFLSTMPLAVERRTLGPPVVNSFRSRLVRLTLPTR
eukprot:13699762-Heterocapsa_arctica.AAC.1